jgi:hypothetical protein
MLSQDYLDVLSAFSDARVDFLVVGAHAVAVHARPRATSDLWVNPTAENARRVWQALTAFGAPLLTNKESTGRPRDLADAAELRGGHDNI